MHTEYPLDSTIIKSNMMDKMHMEHAQYRCTICNDEQYGCTRNTFNGFNNYQLVSGGCCYAVKLLNQ